MPYQMMVLIHITKKKSYCTGNRQFLQAISREELFKIIKNPDIHGDKQTTFNQKFRPLFGENPNELAFVLFVGDNLERVKSRARDFANGRVCNNQTRAQEDPANHYVSQNSKLNPVIITVA